MIMALLGGNVAVVIPARDEAQRIAATVHAAMSIPAVDVVVVVSDASSDATADIARAAGAVVVEGLVHRGKAAAMVAGADAVAVLDQAEHRTTARHLMFLDADLRGSARLAAALVPPVLSGEVDMTIANLPCTTPGGGHGLVVGLARYGVRTATGWVPRQPLSGQRCLTREAFDRSRPLAHGFGVETALTIDLIRAGLRVREIETGLSHRVTGTSWRAQVHRGQQFVHVGRALAARALPPGLLYVTRRVRHVPVPARAA